MPNTDDDVRGRFEFGAITVDSQSNTIICNSGEVRLEPLVMSLLCVLAARHREVVSREDLVDAVWGGKGGGDESLTRAASRLRQALKELKVDRCLETVPKRGYRMHIPEAIDLPLQRVDQTLAEGNQRPSPRGWLIGATIAVSLALLAAFVVNRPDKPVAERALIETPQGETVMLAVFPFAVDEKSSALRHLANGITASIYSRLGNRETTRVLGRQTSRMLSEADDFPAMAQQFDVTHVLEGVLLVNDQRLRVDASITRLADGTTVWASRYDRSIDDVFTLQDELATTVAAVLHFDPADNATASGAVSIRAYELYLQAREMKKDFDLFGESGAIAMLEQAVELDPGWATARAEYASAMQYAAMLRQEDEIFGGQYEAHAREHASQVLSDDPDNVSALATMAMLEALDSNWSRGREFIDRMLTIAPENSRTLFMAGTFFSLTGQLSRAAQMHQAAVEADPGDPEAHTQLAYTSMQIGDHEKTIRHGRLAFLYGAPPAQGAHHALWSLAATGKSEEALALLREMEESPAGAGYYDDIDGRLIKALLADFENEDARQAYVDYIETHNRPFIYALRAMGRPDLSSEIMMRGLEVGEFEKALWKMRNLFVPDLGDFRQSDLFRNFVRRKGLLDYWQTHGWPDVCGPSGSNEFVCE